jgi:hypothetical protein
MLSFAALVLRFGSFRYPSEKPRSDVKTDPAHEATA